MPTTSITIYGLIRNDHEGRRYISLPPELHRQDIETDAAFVNRRAFCRSLRLTLLGIIGLHGQIHIDELPKVGAWGVEESHGFAAVTMVMQHAEVSAITAKQAADASVEAIANAGRAGVDTAEVLARAVATCLMASEYEPHHVNGIEYAKKFEQCMLEGS